MNSIRHTLQTREIPPGRFAMRYLKLRYPLADASTPETTVVRCCSCDEAILSVHEIAKLRDLTVRCPSCGSISRI